MNWHLWSVLSAVIVSWSLTATLRAQDVERTPVFLFQPGLLTTDFISTTASTSSTGFNVRFSTLLPTRSGWLTPVLGVNVTPYGTTGFATAETNAPSVFIGNVFPLVSERQLGGWLRIDAPLLWYWTHDGGGRHNQRLFGHDIYAELAFTSSLGSKLLGDLGPNWKRLEGYLLLDQNLTPNPDRVSTRTDRFNPIALFGLSLRFGKEL
ncbi:MAG: hypothetical protein ABI877_05895 [Gemmatimonadaceae bacterium]